MSCRNKSGNIAVAQSGIYVYIAIVPLFRERHYEGDLLNCIRCLNTNNTVLNMLEERFVI